MNCREKCHCLQEAEPMNDGAEDGGWSFEGDAITRFFLLKICFISSFEAALLSKLVTS